MKLWFFGLEPFHYPDIQGTASNLKHSLPMVADPVEIVDRAPKPSSSGEIRTTDPKTGGQKGVKEDRYDLIPPEFEDALARHYGKGARKYADRNWEKGYKWGLTVRALRSHLNAFLRGERYDNHKADCPDGCLEHTGSHHLVAVAWHAIALFIFDIRNLGTNDIVKFHDTDNQQ